MNLFDLGPTTELPLQRGFYVYVHRDDEGMPLYIGSTTYPANRVGNHAAGRRSRQWWNDVESIDWLRFGSESDMKLAESQAIQAVEPPFNIAGTFRRAHSLVEYRRSEIARRHSGEWAW